jgi:isopenicillin N synthase-like dioxygenase
VDYADLAIIDISKADTEEGRAALAIEVREALLDYGFFYVVNHGYSQDQVRQFFDIVWIINIITTQTDRIFDIADLPFSAVSDSEKKIYAGTMKQSGSYQGYKLRQYWVRGRRVTHHMSVWFTQGNRIQHIDAGVRDQLEHYNSEQNLFVSLSSTCLTSF